MEFISSSGPATVKRSPHLCHWKREGVKDADAEPGDLPILVFSVEDGKVHGIFATQICRELFLFLLNKG